MLGIGLGEEVGFACDQWSTAHCARSIGELPPAGGAVVFRRLDLSTEQVNGHDAACRLIIHTGKESERRARHRVLDSVAFVNASRAAWLVGKMHDEEVSYLWPNETLFVIFLKNNIFYRLWLDAQRK